MRYEVEIMDSDGSGCRIRLSLPLIKNNTDQTNSTWHILDEGRLKFRSGGCQITGKTGESGNLRLWVGDLGVIATLFNFASMWGIANDSGSGEISQPGVVTIKPGKISWTLNS
ncbi:MAG: hypothetical protein ABJA66_02830 [Actinomycetota bacterium]